MGKYFVSRFYNEIFLNEGDFDLIEGECALAENLSFEEASALITSMGFITSSDVHQVISKYGYAVFLSGGAMNKKYKIVSGVLSKSNLCIAEGSHELGDAVVIAENLTIDEAFALGQILGEISPTMAKEYTSKLESGKAPVFWFRKVS